MHHRCAFLGIFAAAILAGCQSAQLPDPNDPKTAGVMAPEVVRNNLKGAAEAVFLRVRVREITDEEGHAILREYADELLANVKADQVRPELAWEYAEALMTARRWNEAIPYLEVAAKVAATEDRRVNDTLRLARCFAETDRPQEAIATARKVFDAPPPDKAPILTAVLLEIAPAIQGKGADVDLARLLEDAITQSQETKVDAESQAGAIFLAARPVHIANAQRLILSLYEGAGRRDLALKAAERMP
jgi:tetratricopeptide (TPR) repeat protein